MTSKFALIIGNTEYTDPGLAQLTAPGRDAADFAHVLEDREIGAFDEVSILMNEPEYVVREAIDDFFSNKKPDDLLVLYFSGHGVRDELGTLYLAVKNTSRNKLRATGIKSDYIREVMDQSRSKRQVLILDCCNSGAFEQGTKSATGVSIGTATAFEAGYGRIILTASDSTQFAFEGDKVIGETGNSLFTHFLVEGLEGEADLDGDGRITVDELYDYAYEKVKLATPKQTPSKFSSKQQGEIVLRNMRIGDVKPVGLPEELIDEIEDSRPYVREAAVRKLEKILKGKNIGMARSAVEALENIISDENTTRRVAQMAMQVLESYRQVERKAEEERRAKEEAERLVILEAEEERLAREKTESERRARDEAEKLLKAQDERKTREESERLAAQKAVEEERIAKAKLEAERLAEKKRADEKAKAEQKAERREEGKKSVKTRWSTSASLGIIIIMLAVCGIATLNYLIGALQSSAREKPQATNTVKPQASRTAIAKSTNTSIASSTNTAIVRSTNTTIARSTNTVIVKSTNTASILEFGPKDGSLKHEADDKIETSGAGVDLRDFIVMATFTNPYPTTTVTWDYGFTFRNESTNAQFRLIIRSNKKWELKNRIEGESSSATIQAGQLTNLNLSTGGSNTIWLYCNGNNGILYVNGSFVADLDLSARMNSGDVKVAIGFYNGSEIEGYSTEYKNFKVEAVQLEFGPKNGSLKHEADDKTENSGAGVDLRDFIATVTFTNPYPATAGTWDYGFMFRNESTNAQYRLFLRSNKKWELKNRIEGESSSTTIQEGQLTNLNTSTGGSNTIWLYCNGNKGILYVNGSFVADLDLSARINSGDVRAVIGFYDGSEIEGNSTDYKDFKIWKIP